MASVSKTTGMKPRALCEICYKEYSNKRSLRTHKCKGKKQLDEAAIRNVVECDMYNDYDKSNNSIEEELDDENSVMEDAVEKEVTRDILNAEIEVFDNIDEVLTIHNTDIYSMVAHMVPSVIDVMVNSVTPVVNSDEDITKLTEECKECDKRQEVEDHLQTTIQNKDGIIKGLGVRLNKMAGIRRVLTRENKSLKKKGVKQTDIDDSDIVYACEVCDLLCNTKSDLMTHTHCSECKLSVQNMQALIEHIKKKHEKEINSICEIRDCKQSKSDIVQFKLKVQRLEDDLKVKDALIESMKIYSNNNEVVKCPRCGKVYKTKQELSSHINENHSPKTGIFSCSVCEAKFTKDHALNQHVNSVHNDDDEQDIEPELLDCTWKCGFRAKSEDDMVKHLDETHLKADHVCSQCGKTTNSDNELKEHKERFHGNQRKPCNNGILCRFLRDNRCRFFHEVSEQPSQWQQPKTRFGVGNRRDPRPNVQQQSAQSGGVKWCNYGDRCNSGRFCPFKHYDSDMRQYSNVQSQSVPSSGVKWCNFGDRCNRGRFCPFKHSVANFPQMVTKMRN